MCAQQRWTVMPWQAGPPASRGRRRRRSSPAARSGRECRGRALPFCGALGPRQEVIDNLLLAVGTQAEDYRRRSRRRHRSCGCAPRPSGPPRRAWIAASRVTRLTGATGRPSRRSRDLPTQCLPGGRSPERTGRSSQWGLYRLVDNPHEDNEGQAVSCPGTGFCVIPWESVLDEEVPVGLIRQFRSESIHSDEWIANYLNAWRSRERWTASRVREVCSDQLELF